MAANKKLDRIYIKDLLLRCIVGIKPEEREKKQDVIINIDIFADLEKSCKSDNIKYTVNYASIKKRVVNLTEKSSFYLIETLAQRIADTCFEDSLVRKVIVRVEKPGALRFARTVGIEIYRERT